jgi:hypothetical protein
MGENDPKPVPKALQLIADALSELRADKPGDRSETDRRYAIVITEVEKAEAIARYFLLGRPQ